MLDLDTQTIPRYEVKVQETTHSFDAVEAMAKLARLTQEFTDTIIPFEKLPELIEETFGLKLNVSQSALLLQDFRKFAEREVQGPLGEIIGSMPSLDTTTDSPERNIDPQMQPS